MKTEVEYLEFMWPMKTFLITCGDIENESNIISVSFCMPAAGQPPQVVCAIGKDFYSYELINKEGEFIVNVPSKDLKQEIYYCGFNSGYEVDKFKETGLTPKPARKVKSPIIEECVAHMECKVVNQCDTKSATESDFDTSIGDKVLFVGEVVEAYANEDVVEDKSSVEWFTDDFPKHVYGVRFGD